MLTRTTGWCADEAVRVPAADVLRFGNGVYDRNGCVWLINVNSASSDAIADGVPLSPVPDGLAGESFAQETAAIEQASVKRVAAITA
jgi:hypothetical protein